MPDADPVRRGLEAVSHQSVLGRTGTAQRLVPAGRQNSVGRAARPHAIEAAAQARAREGGPGDLRIEIGRIEVALPQRRPAPRPRPQPPAFRAKPRGGPDA